MSPIGDNTHTYSTHFVVRTSNSFTRYNLGIDTFVVRPQVGCGFWNSGLDEGWLPHRSPRQTPETHHVQLLLKVGGHY